MEGVRILAQAPVYGTVYFWGWSWAGFASFFSFSKGNSKEVYSHEEYKVIIDDSVSLNDFYEKYEIIDREGEIYTVMERKQG